jgi:hypothetical protein
MTYFCYLRAALRIIFSTHVRVRFLLFVFLPFISSEAAGQVLIGPTAGVNVSWISYDNKDLKDVYNITPVIGYHAGLDVSFQVRKRFFLNTSFIYSTKGKLEKGELDELHRNEVSYRYFEVPIIYTAEFKGKFGKGNREYKWYVGAGPNISYWLGGRGTISSSDFDEVNVLAYDYKIVFRKEPDQVQSGEMGVLDPNRIQLGLNVSTGFVFEPMGYQKFMIMFRYELGHTFLSGETNGTFPGILYQDPMRVRNQGFRISMSYMVDLKISERKKGKSTSKESRRRKR